MKSVIRTTAAATLAALLALPGCDDLSRDEQVLVGGLTGAAVAVVTADMLDVDPDWVVIGALGGAAIGALVAHNRATGECAYAWHDGRYRVGPCPRRHRWR